MIAKLTAHPHANAHVIITPAVTTFVSYSTPVIDIDKNGWLSCSGLYSMTTRKQIGWFLEEYAPAITFQMVKKSVENDTIINIYTGEIVPLFP
jgi:hypothetical protein